MPKICLKKVYTTSAPQAPKIFLDPKFSAPGPTGATGGGVGVDPPSPPTPGRGVGVDPPLPPTIGTSSFPEGPAPGAQAHVPSPPSGGRFWVPGSACLPRQPPTKKKYGQESLERKWFSAYEILAF